MSGVYTGMRGILTAYEWNNQNLLKLSDIYGSLAERRIVELVVRSRRRDCLVTLQGDELTQFKSGYGITGGRSKICFAEEACWPELWTALNWKLPVQFSTPTVTTYDVELPSQDNVKIPSIVSRISEVRDLVLEVLEEKLPGLIGKLLPNLVEKHLGSTPLLEANSPAAPYTYRGELKCSSVEPYRTLEELVKDLSLNSGQKVTSDRCRMMLSYFQFNGPPWRRSEGGQTYWDDDTYVSLLHILLLSQSAANLSKIPQYRGRPKTKYLEKNERDAATMISDLRRVTGIKISENDMARFFVDKQMISPPWRRLDQNTGVIYWDIEAFEELVRMCREGDVVLPGGQTCARPNL
jgi:hypothetical protein